MIGRGENAFNGFGGGAYRPTDTQDYDPDVDGCPVCGHTVSILPGYWLSDDIFCEVHGWFNMSGESINDEAPSDDQSDEAPEEE